MKKVLISTTEDRKEYGFKARYDICDILIKNGYSEKVINTNHIQSMKNLIIDLFKSYKKLKSILKNTQNSYVVFQYPWNSMTLGYAKMINKYSKKNNLKTIIIVHDLNTFRTKKLFGKVYFKWVVNEYKYLNKFDYVICHNHKMKELLLKKGVKRPKIIELGIFDYLIDKCNELDNKNYKSINIAGNLKREKAGYVYDLKNIKSENYNINLYGKYDGPTSDNIIYQGIFQSNELISYLNHGFGLVWDGNSIDECSGSYGKYLKINNPHKFSLYIAYGLPVIVWSESALAKFVLDNKIGYTISSLAELDDIFKNLDVMEYEELLKNVKKINSMVKNGKYILNAVNKVE